MVEIEGETCKYDFIQIIWISRERNREEEKNRRTKQPEKYLFDDQNEKKNLIN